MSDITLIRQWVDSDEPEPEGGYGFPHPPICVESSVSGDLRDRILAKLARSDGDVRLIEREIESGWSEFTIETDYEIEVQIGGERAWSHDYASSSENAMAAFFRWLEA